MRIYPKLFAHFYDKVIHGFEEKISADRKYYLEKLDGKIIDVGSGTGVNFKYFNSKAKIFAVEPSIEMLKRSKDKILEKNIELINLGIHDELLLHKFEQSSIDAIVCTLVLCTIPDPEKALINFKKWLKPSGKLIIIEHIHSANKMNASFQNMVNPIWKKIGEGCNLNRNTEKLLLDTGFVSSESSVFNLGLSILKGVYTLEKN